MHHPACEHITQYVVGSRAKPLFQAPKRKRPRFQNRSLGRVRAELRIVVSLSEQRRAIAQEAEATRNAT